MRNIKTFHVFQAQSTNRRCFPPKCPISGTLRSPLFLFLLCPPTHRQKNFPAQRKQFGKSRSASGIILMGGNSRNWMFLFSEYLTFVFVRTTVIYIKAEKWPLYCFGGSRWEAPGFRIEAWRNSQMNNANYTPPLVLR